MGRRKKLLLVSWWTTICCLLLLLSITTTTTTHVVVEGLNFGMMGMKMSTTTTTTNTADKDEATAASTASDASADSAAAAMMNCDAMMAKSLVLANEQKVVAEAERDQFFSELKQMTVKVESLDTELNKMAVAKAERDQLVSELKQMTVKAESLDTELKKTTRTLTEQLQQATDEMERVSLEGKEALARGEAEWQELKLQHGTEMALLRVKTEEQIANVRDEAEAKLAREEQNHARVLQQKDVHVHRLEQEHADLIQTLRDEAQHNVTRMYTETAEAMTKLQQSHDTIRTKLENELRQQADTCRQTLEQHERDTAKAMKELKKEQDEKYTTLVEESNMKVKRSMLKVKELDKNHEQLTKAFVELDKKYKAASGEIARWEELYGARSYCNFTYMQEDAMQSAIYAQKVVADYATKAGTKLADASKQVAEATKKVAEPLVLKTRNRLIQRSQPHVDKARGLYQQFVQPHVDTYLVPYYNQYMTPLFGKLVTLMTHSVTQVKSLTTRGHDQLVASYKSSCPSTLERLDQMKAPTIVVTPVQTSCRDPTKTVNTSLWAVLLVMVFLFRSFLWGTAVRMVLLPFRILWFFSPMRLFVGLRTSIKKEEQQADANDNGTTSTTRRRAVKSEPRKKMTPSQ